MLKLVVIALTLILQACATIGMLPQNANEVDFYGIEGKTGWSEYKEIATFKNVTIEDVYEAAKIGLGEAGFALRKADISSGMVIGEHGITLHDWNVLAGVYFIEQQGSIKVAVIAEGSKDIGFSGDVTSDGWTGKIINGMREFLYSE